MGVWKGGRTTWRRYDVLKTDIFGSTYDPERSLIVRFPGRHTYGILKFRNQNKTARKTKQL